MRTKAICTMIFTCTTFKGIFLSFLVFHVSVGNVGLEMDVGEDVQHAVAALEREYRVGKQHQQPVQGGKRRRMILMITLLNVALQVSLSFQAIL